MSCFKKGYPLCCPAGRGPAPDGLRRCSGIPGFFRACIVLWASSEAAEQPEEPAMKYTQTPTVPTETYKEEADFADFLSRRSRGGSIPACGKPHPPGHGQCDETGILYISGYYTTDGKSSAILAVDTATGELTAEYLLLNAGGTPFDGHVGGVAVSEDTLYVSGQKQNGLYTICAIPLKDLPAEGSHEVKLEQTIPVPVSPSFLSCSHGYLWVGNFYHPGADYPLSDGMKYTTASADGEDYGCYIMGYDLSKGSLSVADGDDYAQPDVVLVGPNKIQGVVVGEDDTVTLSQSYGRKNNACLLHYSLALGETLDTMLTVQGRDVPGYILDSKRLKESVTAMPMTEALADAKDGGIYVLFESGAIHYANGTFRTDHVWKIKF